MLGVILLYVGMVLMSNGLHRLEGIPDKSNVVMNIFTDVYKRQISTSAHAHQSPIWFMLVAILSLVVTPWGLL